MNTLLVLFSIFAVKHALCLSTCLQYEHRINHAGYHLTKECALSKMRSMASSNATGLESCVKLANAKNAFAFAFTNQTEDLNNTISFTCNVFECPEFHPFLMTASVSIYNYYSMFSKPLPSENFTCAPGIGLFEMVTDRLNYSNAMIACEDNGGHLANIVSDPRTSFLTTLVSSVLVNQTVGQRKAFVGLFFENEFITITGEPLSCLPYRAWAPGHPKARRLKKDCVVLTSNRYWETEDCSIKLPYICELIPDGPLSPVERYCAPITNISNTPFNTISNPSFHNFLETYSGKNVLTETNLRLRYIDDIFDETMSRIKLELSGGKKFRVSIDETTDIEGVFVANVIVGRRKNCILRNHKLFEQMEQTEQQCNNIINTDESEATNGNN